MHCSARCSGFHVVVDFVVVECAPVVSLFCFEWPGTQKVHAEPSNFTVSRQEQCAFLVTYATSLEVVPYLETAGTLRFRCGSDPFQSGRLWLVGGGSVV